MKKMLFISIHMKDCTISREEETTEEHPECHGEAGPA